jgi:two-component sensor histidine kinase
VGIVLRKERIEDADGEEVDGILVAVRNSVRPGSADDRPEGLGRRLIDVLAQQLSGRVETTVAGDSHTISIRFAPTGFDPDDTFHT